MQKSSEDQEYKSLLLKCTVGSHILHYHGVLDAYGHLSFRHPSKPDIFVMPRNMPPANIAGPQDMVQYHVSDASPIDTNAPRGYIERYIHSELYKKYSKVNSVIHSHADAVVPYTISGVPLRPCFHLAGFLGDSIPTYDIADYYEVGDTRDLLVSSARLGGALASSFTRTLPTDEGSQDEPDDVVALMRGHGYTVIGGSIEQSVFRAIYTKENASIQTTSLLLSNACRIQNGEAQPVRYLQEDELNATAALEVSSGTRAWELWAREVELASLYRRQ